MMTSFKYQTGDDLLSFEGKRVRVLGRWTDRNGSTDYVGSKSWPEPLYEVIDYDGGRSDIAAESELSDWEDGS